MPPRQAGDRASLSVALLHSDQPGSAWQSRTVASQDPTPRRPVALRLAMASNGASNTVYVARACQYEARQWHGCQTVVLTLDRYSDANIQAVSQAIDHLKTDNEQPLILIGYSGGGVVAALLAAHRDDVEGFVTVAANLDVDFWTRLHGVTALSGSDLLLNYAARLSQVPQVHFAGEDDDNVPPSVVAPYLNAVGLPADDHLVIESNKKNPQIGGFLSSRCSALPRRR